MERNDEQRLLESGFAATKKIKMKNGFALFFM